MSNPGNICYANTSLQMFIWLGLLMSDLAGVDAVFGRLVAPCMQLQQAGRGHLLRSNFWRDLLLQWCTDVTQQQDAAEFLTFLLEYARPLAYEGRWQSRYQAHSLTFIADSGHTRQPLTFLLEYARPLAYEGRWQSRYQAHSLTFIADSGHTRQPIAVEIHPRGLQANIRQWHSQHYTHALHQAPMVLFLQLKRWTQKRRNLMKNASSFSVEVGEQVLPCFLQVRGLDVQWLAYRVMSFAVHTGASLWSGHYQAVLSGHRQLPDGTTGWCGMITDDNRDI
eukprot:s1851_g5.t1